MSVSGQTASGMADNVKWGAAIVLVALGLAGFYVYAEQSLLLRVVGLLAAIGVAAAVALQTEKGRMVLGFARDARAEVRKVVWPSRKETMQTTGVVIALVALVALILWGLDSLLGWLVRLLLGRGA